MPPRAMAGTTAGAVQIKQGEKTFDGSFTVSGDTLTVAYLNKTRKARLGGSAPEALARQLLEQLVEAAEREKPDTPPPGIPPIRGS